MSASLKLSRVVALALSLLLWATFAYSESSRPNIVWLISEDNSVHYSKLYFQSGAEMPNIGELAEEGVIWMPVITCLEMPTLGLAPAIKEQSKNANSNLDFSF